MNDTKYKKNNKNLLNILYVLILSILYVFIFFRNYNLYLLNPVDETSSFSIIKNKNYLEVPSIFFYTFFQLINYITDYSYNVIKIINLLLFFIGNYIIYVLCKKKLDTHYAKLIFFILSINPFNFYTSVFLPETLFYTFFCFFIFISFHFSNSENYYFYLGFLIFILYTIKPSAIFIIPGVFFIEFVIILKKKKYIKSFFNLSKLIIIFIALYFLTNAIIEQNLTTTIFGKKYNHYINFNYLKIEDIFTIKNYFFINFFGHIFYIVLIFGLPILVGLQHAMGDKKINKFCLLTFSILFSFIIIISVYSSLMTFFYPEENADYRIGTRYYDFIFPALLIILMSILKTKKILFNTNKYIFSFIIFVFLVIIITQLKGFRPTYHIWDGILLRGYTYNQIYFNIFIFFHLFVILSFLFNQIFSIKIYIYIYLPFILIFTSFPIYKEINFYKKANIHDQLGLELLKAANINKNKKILILSEGNIESSRVLFPILIKNFTTTNYNFKKVSSNFSEINSELKGQYDLVIFIKPSKFIEVEKYEKLNGNSNYLIIKNY